MESWYLVYTKPQQEKAARENLERQGYQVYLPLIRHRKRIAGRYQQRIEPMFPRYLFIYLSDTADNWAPIRSTTGVSKLVRFGEVPARVPDDFLRLLQTQDTGEGYLELPTPEFKTGEHVQIVDGALAGYAAIFDSQTSDQRVVVMLDIVGRSTRIKLPADAIDRVQ